MKLNLIALVLTTSFTASCTTIDRTTSRPPQKSQVGAPAVAVRPQKSETLPGQTASSTTDLSNPVHAAQKMLEMKDFPRVAAFVRQSLENPSLSAKERETLFLYRLQAWEETNDLNAFNNLQMNDEELSLVMREARSPVFRSAAAFKLGEGKLAERKQEEAREYFQQAIQGGGDPSTTQKAQDYLSSLDSLRKVEPKTIGVVLPLTGRSAAVAQRTLRGIQFGLGLNGSPTSSFRLAVIDSQGNAEVARRGVERLVSEDNVIAIIGGLQSKTASAEANQASELGVPTISLSLRQGVTEVSPLVFRNTLTAEMQIRRLVRTAMDELGYKRFAVLFPNDAYGVEATNLFWDEVLARGGKITAAQTYSPKETDFRESVERLVGTFFIEARTEEFKTRSKEINEANAQKHRSARINTKEAVLPPMIDFDAIFIPDSMKAFGQISATLAYNEVKNVKLLGTNLWNVDGLQKRAGPFANNLLFVDSYSNTDGRFQNSGFVREYKKTYGVDPGQFEIQGYDSALMLRQLISQGASSRQSLGRALSDLNNLPGLLGPLSVDEDRDILRPVTVLTLENGQIVPWKPSRNP